MNERSRRIITLTSLQQKKKWGRERKKEKKKKGKIHFILTFFFLHIVLHKKSSYISYIHQPWRRKWFSLSPAVPHSHHHGDGKAFVNRHMFSVVRKKSHNNRKHVKVGLRWTEANMQRIYMPGYIHHKLSLENANFCLLRFLWPRSQLLLAGDAKKKPKKRLVLTVVSRLHPATVSGSIAGLLALNVPPSSRNQVIITQRT